MSRPDFCLERWDPLEEEWLHTAAEPSDAITELTGAAEPADDEDEERALHEELQERERQHFF